MLPTFTLMPIPPDDSQPKKKRRPVPNELRDFFNAEGPLAQTLPAYEMRPEQVEVALCVEEMMRDSGIGLIEAGTGVGKTMAYLIPAIRAALRGKKTVVSTHTISLQTQLIQKDIPLALSLFPGATEIVQPVLMKGRANYLCAQSMDYARGNLLFYSDPQFLQIQKWSRRDDCNGDVADLGFTYPYWNELISTPETCRAQECRFYNDCYYYRMRFAASESSLVVVNHSLLLADIAMRLNDPNSGLLPAYDHLVLDEAHHLEDTATRAFGIEFNSRRLVTLMDRIRHIRGLDISKERLDVIEELNKGLFTPFQEAQRGEYYFEDGLSEEAQHQTQLTARDTCNSISILQNELLDIAKTDETMRERIEGLTRLCGRAREELHEIVFANNPNYIRWAETISGGKGRAEKRVTMHLTPISIADVLKSAFWHRPRKGGILLVSATLANSGGFSYQKKRLGIPDDAHELLVGSPFDYKKQAILYVPAHLPEPSGANSKGYITSLVDEVERLIRLTHGRAFLLFTSRSMMNSVHDQLFGRLPYPFFKQGDLPPGKLVQEFKESGNGCLFGVQTFWEGVDVQGEALSIVIIDRIPFAVPDSPIAKARIAAIENEGGNAFKDYSIPQAQIRLKQGFGRLIRTRKDKGVVCILDTRILTRYYGPEFVRHLPPSNRASKWSRLEKFWQTLAPEEE